MSDQPYESPPSHTAGPTANGRYGRLVGWSQFVVLPFLSFCGAAFVTGFPWVDPIYAFEDRAVQYAAILAALGSGLALAVAFWSTAALRRNRLFQHFAVVALALFGAEILWVVPIWGFHHDYSLGIFAWLFLGGEDGFEVLPNILGLPLTLVTFFVAIAVMRALVAEANGD